MRRTPTFRFLRQGDVVRVPFPYTDRDTRQRGERVRHRFSDELNISFGANVFGGDATSPFGALGRRPCAPPPASPR